MGRVPAAYQQDVFAGLHFSAGRASHSAIPRAIHDLGTRRAGELFQHDINTGTDSFDVVALACPPGKGAEVLEKVLADYPDATRGFPRA